MNLSKSLLFIIWILASFSVSAQDILMQNGTFNRCSGVFYDTGGEDGNYANNEDITITICPEEADQKSVLEFTDFRTQGNVDVLTIYDGDDTTAPIIDEFSGTNTDPGTIEASATNTSGCLTIRFVSNAAANTTGWAAIMGCAFPCQDIVATIDTTTPAAVNGIVTINPGETVDFSGSATFSDTGAGATYEWNFGGGGGGQTGQTVSNTFANFGSYPVTFTVTDTNATGCSDTDMVLVNVLGPYIDVSTDIFTTEELVEDILINSACAEITNITSSTGIDYGGGNPNGIGYFSSNGEAFPFTQGIILSTGNALNAEGPETGTLSDGTDLWLGDSDLEDFINTDLDNQPGDDLVTGESRNASYIEFDFVPLADQISFDFIFASEEYGQFQCGFSDAFAFLLTDTTTGTTTNLAFVPGTTQEVSVFTVRNQANNGSCSSENPEYFAAYYDNANGLPQVNSPLDFRGHTTSITAMSSVVPNRTYTIKLVVADDSDTLFDAAVFLEAGSFNLGGSLGDDITIQAGTADCEGGTITLNTQLPTATHVWYKDGVEIPGETDEQIDIIENGEYTVEIILSEICQATDTIIIEFIPSPEIADIQDLVKCDTTGTETFDLAENSPLIYGAQNQDDFSIKYYESLADANVPQDEITDPENYPGTDGDIIYARIEDVLTETCFDIGNFNLIVTPPPTITSVPDMINCDGDENDGISLFDLTDQDAGILGSQSSANFEVSYHLSFDDADMGAGDLAPTDAYVNILNPQPIYVRVQAIGDDNCYIASPTPVFNLVVDNKAVATAPMDMDICDDVSADGEAVFNLTDQIPTILGVQSGGDFSVTFYESQTAAEMGTPAIPNPGSYTNLSNGQTIHVRVQENTGNPLCYGYTSFTLNVNPLPTPVVPDPLEVCDDGTPDGITEMDLSLKNTEITGGNPDYSVTYYETLAAANSGTATPLAIPYTNLFNNQIIFARVENINTGCHAVVPLELIVQQAPIANIPAPLEYCDPDNDGFGVFMLSDADAAITGGVGGLVVTYHGTEANAENNVDALDDPYNNIVAYNQTVYARVESNTITTDCATIIPVALIVHDTPAIEVNLDPLEVCDDASADGFAVFDLTLNNIEVLNGLDPLQYTVNYYETQANAETPINEILNTGAYTNIDVNMQTIWVRVDDTATDCYKITTLELIVNPLPVLQQPDPLELCDDNNPGDLIEGFTLEDASGQILNGQTGITLTFYESQAEAEAGDSTTEITSPYQNTSNPQTVYVRATNDLTSCYSTITLTLEVNPLPSPSLVDPIEVCDDDNDGFSLFDLESRSAEIINGELDVVVTYYETLANAEANTDALASPYANTVANLQTVYARVTRGEDADGTNNTGCFAIVPLDLIVLPSPEVPVTIADYVICDDDNDGVAQFNLTTKNDEILGNQTLADVVLTYHETLADAEDGLDAIVNVENYTNLSNPQTIYVRLVSNINDCVTTTGQFELRVDLPPVAVQPDPLDVCDDELPGETPDERATFDLTVKDLEISGGDASLVVSYYETQMDSELDTDTINPATAYQNTSNPQTVYARLTNPDTGCYAFTTLTLNVLPNPSPSIDPEDLIVCDDINAGDETEVFNLTDNQAYIINNESGVTASYYTDEEDANAGENAIVDPIAFENTSNPQTIYVRVTNGDDPAGTNGTGCYAIVSFDLIINPLPNVTGLDVDDLKLIACEFDGDDTELFNLEENTPALQEFLFDNGQDPAGYGIAYYETLAAAQSGLGAIGNSGAYQNTSNPQTIYVNITNVTTECQLTTVSFEIEVQDGAEASNPLMDYVICDNIGDIDDGLAQFNLTGTPNNDGYDYTNTGNPDLYTEILDGQDPANFTITFYETLVQATSGTLNDQLPFVYENLSNPQTIFIRVDNDTPVGGVDSSTCYAIAEMVLRVNPLPVFDLDDSYVICREVGTNVVIDTPPTIDTGLSTAAYSFEWYDDATGALLGTDSSYVPTQGGTYSVIVTDNVTGCENMDTTIVNESSDPVISAELLSDAFASDHVIEVTATSQGLINDISVYEFSINDGPWQEGTAVGNVFSYTFTNDILIGENIIRVRDLNGCGEAERTITVLDYPLYFTPNGDGYNETWNIGGIANQPSAKIYIFDRFGKLLKQISPTGQGWDGTYNGENMPNNDYWFTAEYNEPRTGKRKEFKAHFSLKR